MPTEELTEAVEITEAVDEEENFAAEDSVEIQAGGDYNRMSAYLSDIYCFGQLLVLEVVPVQTPIFMRFVADCTLRTVVPTNAVVLSSSLASQPSQTNSIRRSSADTNAS